LVLVLSIGAGLGLAELAPAVAQHLGPLVGAGVFLLIWVVMFGVDIERLASAVGLRRFFIVAIGLNFVVDPLLAWGLGRTFLSDQPDLRMGLLLFLVTPCIGWYLVFTELARGDTELGVSLLGVNLVLQVLLLPVYLLVFEGQAASVQIDDVVRSVVVFLVLPALLAAVTRAAMRRSGVDRAAVCDELDRSQVKTGLLVVVIVSMFASQADAIFDDPGVFVELVPAMVAFFALAFVAALLAARAAGLGYEATVTLAFSAVSRNSEASLAVATTAFASPLVALAVVLGPVIELPFLVLMVRGLVARAPTGRPSRSGPSVS